MNVPLPGGPILRFYLNLQGCVPLRTTILFWGPGPFVEKVSEDAMGERPPISMRKVNLSGAILRDWRPVFVFFFCEREMDFLVGGGQMANGGIFSFWHLPPPKNKCQQKCFRFRKQHIHFIHFAYLKCGCTIEASRNGMKGSVR